MSNFRKLEEELKTYDKEWRVRFAIWCARKALPIWEEKFAEDKRPALAIQAAQNCLDNPSLENAKLANTAANAAYWAANAANAAYVARAAAMTAAAAAYACAASAARAAAIALNNGQSCLDLFEKYKKSLELNTVSLQELNAGL